MTHSSTFSISCTLARHDRTISMVKCTYINLILATSMCYIFLDLLPQVPLALLVCLAQLVGLCSQRKLFTLDMVPSESHICCILFVSTGPKGDRGYKGDQGQQGLTVRTSESLSSTRTEGEHLLLLVFYERCSI